MVAQMHKIYRVKNHSVDGHVDSIVHRGLVYHLYRYYSSKTTAMSGMKHIRSLFPQGVRMGNRYTVAKTAKGWGVFQSGGRGYHIKASEIGKWLVK